ncbi:hypothetical protein [Streptomyces sp. B6B3]|uniref:hypothetical protein n=1 Tax=Streptomyces sp. B6B3 TaxID=3153570 RepID=UPI00325DF10A
MRRIQTGLVAGLALLALTGTVSGCSSDDGDEPIEGAETGPGSSEESENDDESAAEAEVADLYLAYWDAVIELENGDELDRSLFDGLATTGVVESEVGRVSAFKDNGVHREGEPTIENVTVTIDGDTARIEACKNEADWRVVDGNGEVPDAVPENLQRPHPNVVTAERTDGEWLITATLPTEGATITC